MKNKILNSLFLAFSVLFLSSSMAYGETNRYIYDDLGRLIGVVDSEGNSAVYQYDSVGNLVEIIKTTAGELAVLNVTPSRAAAGVEVVITGSGFSEDPGQNEVSFTGNASAVVTASAANSITVVVPVEAQDGPITVTNTGGTAASPQSFTVLPRITSVEPVFGFQGDTIESFIIRGDHLFDADLIEFIPRQGITITSDPVVDPTGTQAVISISINADANTGGRAVVLENPKGTTDPALSEANTFAVFSGNLFAGSPAVRVFVPKVEDHDHLRVFVEPLPKPILSPLVGVEVQSP